MNIYLDFDNTLFNTDRLFNDIIILCEKYGIESKYILSARKCVIPFNLDGLLKYLDNKIVLDDKISSKLNQILVDTSKYLFDDVYDFISYLNEKKYKVHIITCGSSDWQNMKIKSSGINKIIDDIIITDNKGNIESIDYSSSIFVDDNPKHLKVFLDKNAKKVIRLKRDGLFYSNQLLDNSRIITCNSLYDIKKHL